MPSCGGPVYQPTTVSYEARSTGGPSFLGLGTSVNSPLRIFRKRRPQLLLLLFALITLSAGIAMTASGASNFIKDQEFIIQQKEQMPIEQTTDGEVSETQTETIIPCDNFYLGLMMSGIIITCFGIFAMGIYISFADWRRKCGCSCSIFDKKQSLARQLQCQNIDGGCNQGIMALNPSTDPLVSHTQYAPVSELPSLRADEEERRNLMPDNKDCLSSAEESDRMLEPDPRIVLRPVGRVEDA